MNFVFETKTAVTKQDGKEASFLLILEFFSQICYF